MVIRGGYHIDKNGFYGDFGGAFIPEMLHANVEELRVKYISLSNAPSFQKEYKKLLKDYVGRPSPLYFASKLSNHYGSKIYLKSLLCLLNMWGTTPASVAK